jgi:hypothetical protein
MASKIGLRRGPFLTGVFLIAFSTLQFQILQTRILSVMVWYSMAFFAISIAMLGMTAGAVWVYLGRERLQVTPLSVTLTDFAFYAALAMPASMIVQFCLITAPTLSLTMVVSWALLSALMAVPYVFAGVVLTLALTRSPFPTGQVYGVDLLGAALGCISVLGLLNLLDGPTAVMVTGAIAAVASMTFAASAVGEERQFLNCRSWKRKPATLVAALLALAVFGALSPIGFTPILSKNDVDFRGKFHMFEKWNTFSRIRASRPHLMPPELWAPSPKLPAGLRVPKVVINIDDLYNSSNMFHYDGTKESIDFLKYDLVNLGYHLPGIHKSAVIGVGGGQDMMSAHLFGVADITGVDVNPIIVHLHTDDPFYKNFSNLTAIPNLKLHVEDARSWFAGTHEKFDLIQMSIAISWTSTSAGAFSMSENGLYTLEGWRVFLKSLNSNGIFTLSHWYSPSEVNESGRMIGLATAALLDAGVKDARPHLFVADDGKLATLVLCKTPFTAEQLQALHEAVQQGGFFVMLAPDRPADSPLLRQIVASPDLASLNRVLGSTYLDLTVPTDRRPFYFNQLRIFDLPSMAAALREMSRSGFSGIWCGNLVASLVLLMILFLAIIAVIATILVPLRHAARDCSRPLAVAGSVYFSLIGMGFMLAEIALLQVFSVYLGHPNYSLGVCLFSLILASGLGSLASDRLHLNTRTKLLLWGGIVVAYLVMMEQILPSIFNATTDRERLVRIGISLGAILPLGFLLGFAFPTGMRLVSAIDNQPTPWFWGINGATGVLASVLGIIFSISFGIHVTMLIAAGCYLLVIPTSFLLLALRPQSTQLA